MADITDYTNLITSQHRKPLFLAMVAAFTQPFVDIQNQTLALPSLFDLDVAVGDQLDKVGVRVGATRVLEIPLTGVFFSWDTDGLGWDQGQWQGPYQDGDTLYELSDDDFRLLLRAVIARNHWDGTVPGAYEVWKIAFGAAGYTLLMQDNQDDSIEIIVIGPELSAVSRALLIGEQLALKPAGVSIKGYYKPFPAGQPMFGFDYESDLIAGWDEGNWAVPI